MNDELDADAERYNWTVESLPDGGFVVTEPAPDGSLIEMARTSAGTRYNALRRAMETMMERCLSD